MFPMDLVQVAEPIVLMVRAMPKYGGDSCSDIRKGRQMSALDSRNYQWISFGRSGWSVLTSPR